MSGRVDSSWPNFTRSGRARRASPEPRARSVSGLASGGAAGRADSRSRAASHPADLRPPLPRLRWTRAMRHGISARLSRGRLEQPDAMLELRDAQRELVDLLATDADPLSRTRARTPRRGGGRASRPRRATPASVSRTAARIASRSTPTRRARSSASSSAASSPSVARPIPASMISERRASRRRPRCVHRLPDLTSAPSPVAALTRARPRGRRPLRRGARAVASRGADAVTGPRRGAAGAGAQWRVAAATGASGAAGLSSRRAADRPRPRSRRRDGARTPARAP